MNYPQIMFPSPLPLKVGGHVPQLLWDRRPCPQSGSSCSRDAVPCQCSLC